MSPLSKLSQRKPQILRRLGGSTGLSLFLAPHDLTMASSLYPTEKIRKFVRDFHRLNKMKEPFQPFK